MTGPPSHPATGPVVRAMSIGFTSGYGWKLTGTDWGVVVWASRGISTVTIDARVWVMSPRQALWIPPHVAHAVRMSGRGTLRQVYVAEHATAAIPLSPESISVTPLLREILRRICALGALDADVPSEQHLLDILCDEVMAARDSLGDHAILPPLLPMPVDPRALRAAAAIRGDVTVTWDPHRIATMSHASVRTLERLFRSETGMSLGAWCRRARLIHAMTLLADGADVTTAGVATGYATTSAFVAAFRRDIGVTPGRYASSTRGSGEG
ncbi:MAG: helix-turn-helix transcriptional regulator [Gemmatimonadaceae bacterium]|nr:helix-turn-helix transcriptional regulator [Gemmatimonadaceae bacterium]